MSEFYITAKENRSTAFKQDLHYTRLAVAAGGLSSEQAFNDLQEGEMKGVFAPNVAIDVENCLKNIESGNCPQYPGHN